MARENTSISLKREKISIADSHIIKVYINEHFLCYNCELTFQMKIQERLEWRGDKISSSDIANDLLSMLWLPRTTVQSHDAIPVKKK